MSRNLHPSLSALLTASAICLICLAQAQQGLQGPQGRRSAVDNIERTIGVYLNGEELKSILTPGEFTEWTLHLKAGEVVIGEARSDYFDAALEIAEGKDTVLASNDDRYPGDQRPLLLWRCVKDGDYGLRVRCFHDKSGGQFFMRYKVYETVDLISNDKVTKAMSGRAPFLLRIPMKAGQIKDIVADFGGNENFMYFGPNVVISPTGLPEHMPSLAEPLSPAISAIVAPVDGDYYLMETPARNSPANGRVRVGTREFVPIKVVAEGSTLTAKAPTNTPAIFQFTVKKGDLLTFSLSDLDLGAQLRLGEAPDVSKFDLSKPEANPFFPPAADAPAGPIPAFDLLPARARDPRIGVFQAKREATLWLSTNGVGPAGHQVAVQIRPAATTLEANGAKNGNLKIGNTDYWSFEANAGDVMVLSSATTEFSQQVVVRDTDLNEIRHSIAGPDQTSDSWQMVIQRPGRYLVLISCLGDGGSGAYKVSRVVVPAKEFGKASPAKAEISDGDIQVWRFTVQPNDPLLLKWTSSLWSYDVAIFNEKGQPTGFQRQEVDSHTQFGIIRVTQPQTFVVLLTGRGAKANYSIDLQSLPGYKPGG